METAMMLENPVGQIFQVIVDGQLWPMPFLSVDQAASATKHMADDGHSVEIIDAVTRRTVNRLDRQRG